MNSASAKFFSLHFLNLKKQINTFDLMRLTISRKLLNERALRFLNLTKKHKPLTKLGEGVK